MKTETRIVKKNGRRFVLLPEAEYRRLKRLDDDALPRMPRPDRHGNYPAVEAATVSIARSIARERRALGLTQAQLAELAGVRQETISRLEAAKHVPSIATVDKIDRALKAAASKPVRRKRHQ